MHGSQSLPVKVSIGMSYQGRCHSYDYAEPFKDSQNDSGQAMNIAI